MRCDGNEDDVKETVGEMLKYVAQMESLLTSVSGKGGTAVFSLQYTLG